jgi:hypothetical protein
MDNQWGIKVYLEQNLIKDQAGPLQHLCKWGCAKGFGQLQTAKFLQSGVCGLSQRRGRRGLYQSSGSFDDPGLPIWQTELAHTLGMFW